MLKIVARLLICLGWSLGCAQAPPMTTTVPKDLAVHQPNLEDTKNFILVRLRKSFSPDLIMKVEINENSITYGHWAKPSPENECRAKIDVANIDLSAMETITDPTSSEQLIEIMPKAGSQWTIVKNGGCAYFTNREVAFIVDPKDADELMKAIIYWGKQIGNTSYIKLNFD